MVDRGGHPRLALEPLPERSSRARSGAEQLERDRAPEAQLGGPVHHAHAAAAGDRFDAAAGELVTWFELGHPSIVTRRRWVPDSHGSRRPCLVPRPDRRRAGGARTGTRSAPSAHARCPTWTSSTARSSTPATATASPTRPTSTVSTSAASCSPRRRAAQRLPKPGQNAASMEADDLTPGGLDDKLRRAWDYLSGNYLVSARADRAARARGQATRLPITTRTAPTMIIPCSSTRSRRC